MSKKRRLKQWQPEHQVAAEQDVDSDLMSMSHGDLVAEIIKLRAGIRKHRDATGHNLCWYVPELWELLPETVEPEPEIPPTNEFLARCEAYRDSLDKKLT